VARGYNLLMEPVTVVTTALSIAKAAGEISKRLFEVGKSIRDRDIKQQLDEIANKVRELKQSASELEDENRDLREKLRFKSDEYEFRDPYWYHKARPEQPLCPKCFAKNIAAPMGSGSDRCLVCSQFSY